MYIYTLYCTFNNVERNTNYKKIMNSDLQINISEIELILINSISILY